jgi:hypothetical protein
MTLKTLNLYTFAILVIDTLVLSVGILWPFIAVVLFIVIVNDVYDDGSELYAYITACTGRGGGEGPFQKAR